MKRSLWLPLSISAVLFSSRAAVADSASETSARGAQEGRAISAAKAARLAPVLPRYEPLQPEHAEASPDLRETDRPRNTIPRLPEVLVRPEKPRVLREREVLTQRERLERALKKHPGLRFGSFWIFRNDGIALMMAAEEERLEQQREMGDLIRLMSPAEQKKVKPHFERAFMRQPSPSR